MDRPGLSVSRAFSLGSNVTDAPDNFTRDRFAELAAAIDGDQTVDSSLGEAGDSYPVSLEVVRRCCDEPLNDTGNSQRLLAHFGRDMLHVREVGWHIYDGRRWCREGGDEQAVLWAQRTAARIALEADELTMTPSERMAVERAGEAEGQLDTLESVASPTDEQRAQMRVLRNIVDAGEEAQAQLESRQGKRRTFAVTSGNSGRIAGMIAQALPHVTVEPGAMDAEPTAINVENGTLRFDRLEEDDPDGTEATGYKRTVYRPRLDPHRREDRIAKMMPVEFDRAAICPRFDAFMTRFQPNANIRQFLQSYLGYAMTGLTGEQCLAFLHGLGANGKSTLVEIVCRVMGDYALTLSFESLAGENGRRGDQASPDLARLPGARLVRASEPERGVHFKEALLKSLTGGEPMLVRHLHKGFFEFRPSFKLVLSGNHKPQIGGVDHGIWRRMRLVPWTVTIPDDERRPIEDVLAEFWQERAGILNWLLEGVAKYLAEGLSVPPEISKATADYRADMDMVGGFVTDCVTIDKSDPPSTVLAREMYQAYKVWCLANSYPSYKERGFAQVMAEKGFVRKREAAGRKYLYVRLHDVPKNIRADDRQPPEIDPPDDEVPM